MDTPDPVRSDPVDKEDPVENKDPLDKADSADKPEPAAMSGAVDKQVSVGIVHLSPGSMRVIQKMNTDIGVFSCRRRAPATKKSYAYDSYSISSTFESARSKHTGLKRRRL